VGLLRHAAPDHLDLFWQRALGASTINFDGFYAYATWYLTGESPAEQYRGHEEFNAPGNGNVAQIEILHPWSAGGWGALEAAARVSEINLNSGGFLFLPPLGTPSNIQGGRQSDFTLGLNWQLLTSSFRAELELSRSWRG